MQTVDEFLQAKASFTYSTKDDTISATVVKWLVSRNVQFTAARNMSGTWVFSIETTIEKSYEVTNFLKNRQEAKA